MILDIPAHSRDLPPGTILRRKYLGTTYVVYVLDNAAKPNGGRLGEKCRRLGWWRYLYNGQRYRSLSGIAYEITGARYWSGHRFFGLKGG